LVIIVYRKQCFTVDSCIVDHRFSGRKRGPRAKEIMFAMKEVGIEANYHKANRARQIAEDALRGSPEDSYSLLHSWMHMLKQVNPGSYTTVVTKANIAFGLLAVALGLYQS